MEKKAAKQQKDEKITMKCLSEDHSANKQDSHRLLVTMVTKRPGVFNSSVYNKDEIKHIYRAYGIKFVANLFYFILLDLPTRAGSPQQHMPITVGPFYLTHPVNFPCGRKPEYPGKTHDFGRALTFYSFHMRTGFESH